MNIHHIFIFSEEHGQVADELVSFGLTEGSNRAHIGQGTSNRKFYFDNFYLEILWVHDQSEIKSELIKSTGLHDRSNFKVNDFSPYGLCVVNDESTNKLFENSYKYQPQYFPDGITIEVLKNENEPSLPWMFRLPFKGQVKNENEPTVHKTQMKELSAATFLYKGDVDSDFSENFKREKNVKFLKSNEYHLILTFDNHQQGKRRTFERLKLTIEY